MKRANWTLRISQTGQKKNILIGYSKKKYCVLELPDFLDSSLEIDNKRFLKNDLSCKNIDFKFIKETEEIIKIQSPPKSDKIFLVTNLKIYTLEEEDHKPKLICSDIGKLQIKSIHFSNENTITLINKHNEILIIQNFLLKKKQEIKKLKNEPLDTPYLVDTNGEFVIIREIEPYTKSKIYTIFNASQPLVSIRKSVSIFEKHSYCHGIILNNTIILFGNEGHYMVYKTDMDGFIRTRDLREQNLVAAAYTGTCGDTLVKYFLDPEKKSVYRKVSPINKISLTCEASEEYITLWKHTKYAKFLTYVDLKSNGEEQGIKHIAHEIVWVNNVNRVGIFVWVLLTIFFSCGIWQICKGIKKSREDNRLIEKLGQHDGSLKAAGSRKVKKRITEFFRGLRGEDRFDDPQDGYASLEGSLNEERESSQSWAFYKRNQSREHRYARNKSALSGGKKSLIRKFEK